MAHTCPDCGQQCHCGGDIDDCCNDFECDVINCTHCEGQENESEDDYPFFCSMGEFIAYMQIPEVERIKYKHE
jgi:hypothetical protein